MNRIAKLIFTSALLMIIASFGWSYETEHVVVVLIDGVRYTESFGDTTGTYCPRLTALQSQGVVHDSAFNDVATYTSMGVPATWMGRFYPLQDTTIAGDDVQFCRYPTFWEYARHDLGLYDARVIYVTPDYGTSLWLPSFYPGYGTDYWPSFHLSTNSDSAVFDSALTVITRDHPVVSYIYFPETDHAGHSGDWNYYISAIREADSLTATLWDSIQADPVMAGKTTMIVTNDHGRHDDDHGGFTGHGCDCFGCRHVMMFAMGPDFKRGDHVDSPRASITDIAATIGELLGFNTEFNTGRVLEELFIDYYEYLPGDCNMYAGSWPPAVIGADVTYLVSYFRGAGPSCLLDGFYAAADINGDCMVIGSDVTYLVNYFRGMNPVNFCTDYYPAWPTSNDLPATAPSGWPGCE